jgi:hypothetical protein
VKKLDLKKLLGRLYAPTGRTIHLVQVPRLQFAMIEGRIGKSQSPSTSPGFQQATQALYGIAYTLKFMMKQRKSGAVDYPVMALEGLWWIDDGKFDITRPGNWLYTLMILEPDVITQETFEQGLEEVRRKRGDSPALSALRLAAFEEGLCVQVMHIGPYSEEPSTIERMEAFAHEKGYTDAVGHGGKHHEIYLGDPRKANPARLKTVLRHPLMGRR